MSCGFAEYLPQPRSGREADLSAMKAADSNVGAPVVLARSARARRIRKKCLAFYASLPHHAPGMLQAIR